MKDDSKPTSKYDDYRNKNLNWAEAYPDESKFPSYPEPTCPEPSMDELERQGFDGIVEATDGCRVEPDGVCFHGYPSWFLYLGLI